MTFVDSLPYSLLGFFTVAMLLAPFTPEPHLVEKWRMFRAGTLRRPIDLFDVAFHLFPLALLLVKVARDVGGAGLA
jgi:hypothetical protein